MVSIEPMSGKRIYTQAEQRSDVNARFETRFNQRLNDPAIAWGYRKGTLRPEILSFINSNPDAKAIVMSTKNVGSGQYYNNGKITTTIGGRFFSEIDNPGMIKPQTTTKIVKKTVIEAEVNGKTVRIPISKGVQEKIAQAGGLEKVMGYSDLPTFQTDAGITFQPKATGEPGRLPGEFIYTTPWGNVSSKPDQLEKNIQRRIDVTTWTDQGRLQLYQISELQKHIQKEKDKPLNRAYYSITHGWYEVPSAVIGGTIFAGRGRYGSDPIHNFQKGLSEISKNYDKWVTYQVKGGSKIPLAIQDIVTSTGPVFGLHFGTATVGSVATWTLKKSVVTGAVQGLGAGLTAIGTAEMVKGIRSGEAIRTGQGVITAVGGMGLLRASWSGIEQALKVDFPELNEPKIMTQLTTSKALQYYDPDKNEVLGQQQTKLVAKVGKDTYVGTAKTDYNTLIYDKVSKTYGYTRTNIMDMTTKNIHKTDNLFISLNRQFPKELGQMVNIDTKNTILTRTLYGHADMTNIEMLNFNIEARSMNRAGIELTLNTIPDLKGVSSMTKITESFKTVLGRIPKETFSVTLGNDYKSISAGSTSINTITTKLSDLSSQISSSINTGGFQLLQTHTDKVTGLSGGVTGLESSIFKDVVKNIAINTPKTVGLSTSIVFPKVNLDLKQKLNTATATRVTTISRTANKQRTMTLSDITAQITATTGKTKTANLLGNINAQALGSLRLSAVRLPDLSLNQLTQTSTPTIGPVSTVPSIPNPTIPDFDVKIPIIKLPDFDLSGSTFGRVRRGRTKKRRAKTSYKPSFEALDRMLRGPKPKIITGLGLRPIPKRKTKKRRKK